MYGLKCLPLGLNMGHEAGLFKIKIALKIRRLIWRIFDFVLRTKPEKACKR